MYRSRDRAIRLVAERTNESHHTTDVTPHHATNLGDALRKLARVHPLERLPPPPPTAGPPGRGGHGVKQEIRSRTNQETPHLHMQRWNFFIFYAHATMETMTRKTGVSEPDLQVPICPAQLFLSRILDLQCWEPRGTRGSHTHRAWKLSIRLITTLRRAIPTTSRV